MANPSNVCPQCFQCFEPNQTICRGCGKELIVQPNSLSQILAKADEIRTEQQKPGTAKSAFDHLKQNQYIPPGYDTLEATESPDNLEIVGACPKCGGPIYGTRKLPISETPKTQFSCTCRHTR